MKGSRRMCIMPQWALVLGSIPALSGENYELDPHPGHTKEFKIGNGC